jgi:hypothetical protein
MLRASTNRVPGLPMDTGPGCRAAAFTKMLAGRACSPTEDAIRSWISGM